MTSSPAEPLGLADIISFVHDGLEDLLVELDGQVYNAEDLHSCAGGCALRTPSKHDLDADGLCAQCAREADEEHRHLRELASDYRQSV